MPRFILDHSISFQPFSSANVKINRLSLSKLFPVNTSPKANVSSMLGQRRRRRTSIVALRVCGVTASISEHPIKRQSEKLTKIRKNSEFGRNSPFSKLYMVISLGLGPTNTIFSSAGDTANLVKQKTQYIISND